MNRRLTPSGLQQEKICAKQVIMKKNIITLLSGAKVSYYKPNTGLCFLSRLASTTIRLYPDNREVAPKTDFCMHCIRYVKSTNLVYDNLVLHVKEQR